MKRGVQTIQDLKDRSEFDPLKLCWRWQGAMSRSGNRSAPVIWTYDHDRHEKRSIHGPRAVWNIAHQEPVRGRRPFRCCGSHDCVNPAHHRIAGSHAEMMRILANLGLFKGKGLEAKRESSKLGRLAQGMVDTPEWKVLRIMQMRGATNVAIAEELDMHHSTVSKIRLGKSQTHITGIVRP